jgi:hypothetical protein
MVSDLIFMSIQSSICYFCVASITWTWAGKPAQQRMILCPGSLQSSDTRAAWWKDKNQMRQINGEAACEIGFAFEA